MNNQTEINNSLSDENLEELLEEILEEILGEEKKPRSNEEMEEIYKECGI